MGAVGNRGRPVSKERWARRRVHGSGGVHSLCDEAAFVRRRADLAQTVSTGCTMAGDLTGVLLDENPRLFPLADNGGPTLTHAFAAECSRERG